jgi:hypothetical protein
MPRLLNNILFVILSFLFLISACIEDQPHIANILPAVDYKTGWWIDRDYTSSSTLSTYGEQGNTLVLLAGWFVDTDQMDSTLNFLDQAQQSGIKMIVGLEGGATPTMSISSFTTVVNTLKNHPALYGWYIGDEPELTDDQSLLQSRHNLFANSPGYYSLLKSLDPSHPAMISFNQPYNESQWTNQSVFYDVTDIIGIHSYPFWTGAEFGTEEGRSVYDVWQRGLTNSKNLGKDFIATMQGFGDGHGYPYRTPTVNELRYQVFTAMVQGVDKILFWIDSWGRESNMTKMIKNQIAQIQDIVPEMNYGITNDSRIKVSVTDKNKLVYRYGIYGNRNVILAVNIANRRSPTGQVLSNVQFTLPLGVSVNSVNVMGENRTIPVNDGVFTDTFQRFTVHVYEFQTNDVVSVP